MNERSSLTGRSKAWRAGWGLGMADTEEISPHTLSIPAESEGDYCFQNAATCPECGGGIMRLGTCFVCGVCGSGGCDGG